MIIKQTYPDKTVALARQITEEQGSLKRRRADALQSLARELLDSLPADQEWPAKVFVLFYDVRNAANKKELVLAMTEAAEAIMETAKQERGERWRAVERNAFYAKQAASLAGLREQARKEAEECIGHVRGWESDIRDFMEIKAREEVVAVFCWMVEQCCFNMSLSQATETALHRIQEELLREAGFGLNRSTSQVHNVAEDAKQQARSKLLQDAAYRCLQPVDHSKAAEA